MTPLGCVVVVLVVVVLVVVVVVVLVVYSDLVSLSFGYSTTYPSKRYA